jgi:hypothetical protein
VSKINNSDLDKENLEKVSFHSFKECPTEEDKADSSEDDQEHPDDHNDDYMVSFTEVEDNAMEEHHQNKQSDQEAVNFYAHMLKQIEFSKFN